MKNYVGGITAILILFLLLFSSEILGLFVE